MGEFETWWAGCWLKVGKLAAKREYDKARRSHGATEEQLLVGRDAYKTHKPAWQAWVHPRTWLSQGRWMDEYKTAQAAPAEDWFDECKRIHGGACGLSQMAHYNRKLIDAGKAGSSR